MQVRTYVADNVHRVQLYHIVYIYSYCARVTPDSAKPPPPSEWLIDRWASNRHAWIGILISANALHATVTTRNGL